MDGKTPFEGWAIVELLGHRRIGAYVTETQLAGAGMFRLDIPEGLDDADRAFDEQPPADLVATQYYPPGALYCLTPSSERAARIAARFEPPVKSWEIPKPRELEPVRDEYDVEDVRLDDVDELEREQEEREAMEDPDDPIEVGAGGSRLSQHLPGLSDDPETQTDDFRF